jgi:zinc transport system ATP-binding protein
MKKIISIENLSFSYNKDIILEDINLSVYEKDFLAIIGPNGGGKSTLLKLLIGLNKLKYGTVKIFDKDILLNLSTIGYVPQNTNINTDFPIKVIEIVLMGHVGSKRPIFGYGKDEKLCAMGALTQVGMANFYDCKIGTLSGGQRQRVMIARALCGNPKILLLDEPTSSVDINGQKQIYNLLKKLNHHITIVVVSHDISVILEYASKVAYINKKISYHDISSQSNKFNTKDNHFCEIELLQMLNHDSKKGCTC